MLLVRIAAYELIVEIQADVAYPDALSDIVNRATESFTKAVETMKNAEIPIAGADELVEDED